MKKNSKKTIKISADVLKQLTEGELKKIVGASAGAQSAMKD